MTATYELLSTRDDVVAYLAGRGILPRIATTRDAVDVREVTAGNMNRVFIASGPLGSVAVKQAPPWVQVVGPEWPVDPSRIAAEARVYEVLADLVPDAVPAIDAVDLDRFVLVMEDLSDLRVLRDVLVEQVAEAAAGLPVAPLDLAELGRVVGRFSAALTLATSRVGLDAAAHAALTAQAANPELCAMTVAVVLDEPFRAHDHNHWLPELEHAVRSMYTDEALLAAVADLRVRFDSRDEALIHGDLHSGSVMVGHRADGQVTKVFDPEFGFVGPIGMDLGLFWSNLLIAATAAEHAGLPDLADARRSAVPASWHEFSRIVRDRWAARVGTPTGLDANPPDADDWLDRIRADAWGFAGVEAIRRIAGFSHAADLTTLPESAATAAHAEVLARARGWVIDHTDAMLDAAGAPAEGSAA